MNRLVLILLISPFLSLAQPEDLSQVWPAKWIAAEDGPWKEYAVHRFRKTFELESIPDTLIVHTSGDNRYQLFVNGVLLNWGPQRGDLGHWYYESTDIASHLQPGKNGIAVQVINYGSHPPDAQMSIQTAFVLAANDKSYRFLNTNKSWKAIHDPSYSPNIVGSDQVRGYYGGGSREIVDGRRYIWNWEKTDFDDGSWLAAAEVENAFAKTCIWASRWKLTPRTLPQEKVSSQRFAALRLVEHALAAPFSDSRPSPIRISPHTQARLVFDQGVETTAYPELRVSGGKDAVITLRYVEAPILGEAGSRKKGNRNEIEGKSFFGYFDRFIADGGKNRTYRPLWWRAFRYIEITIETKGTPLNILDFKSSFSTYPFELKAGFTLEGLPEVQNDTLQQILNIGERTIRLCAHETFMDCPYYEESQFEGDTRVQALISYVNFGDGSLGKNAIEQFSWSLNSEGFLSARYPTNSTYYIPNYSLYWIGMLYDYMMYFGEREFIREKLPIARLLLEYFLNRQRADGTIKRPDYHNFVDWSFPRGEAPFDEKGYSALVDLHVLLALQWAAKLEAYAGEAHFEATYQEQAERLKQIIPTLYWQEKRSLFSDTPKGDQYSVHTNQLAILTGLAGSKKAEVIMKKTLERKGDMTPPTIYWQFYQFEALKAAGLGGNYLNHLDIWKAMIRAGVSTWPETGLESRSECHGWGASPNYHLYKIIAGIEPAAAGFVEVNIAPQIKEGEGLKCRYPHPSGMINIELNNDQHKLHGSIQLPEGIEGTLIWKGEEISLTGGINMVKR